MSHAFGDQLRQLLSQKHGLSQSRLAAGVGLAPPVISAMCQGQRLSGPQARARVIAIAAWLQQQGALTTREAATALFAAAGMIGLRPDVTEEHDLLVLLAAGPPTAPPSSAPPPLLVRPPVADFTGRHAERAAIAATLRQPSPSGRCIALCGMGGIGKTELAHAIAQDVADHFPDGSVLIPLRGMSDTPLTPTQALYAALRSLTNDALPDDLAALSALLYRLLSTKRVLFLADDVGDPDQVRGLALPAGSALLLTTRRRFTLPGLDRVDIEPLLPDDAARLLTRICPRVDGYSAALSEVCGYLPLALRVSASVLVNDDTYGVATYIARLADERTRIDGLRDPDDPALDVGASLRLSVAALPASIQEGLHQLSVFPGSFDAAAADAVVVLPDQSPISAVLSSLRRQNLISVEPVTGRYLLHDLVRAFARRLMRAQEDGYQTPPFQLVCERYAAYYTTLARTAEAALRGPEQSHWLSRLDEDLHNIRATLQWFQDAGDPGSAVAVVSALFMFWSTRAYYAECRRWLIALLPAATDAAPADLAKGWKVLGVMAFRQGEYAGALDAYTHSLTWYAATGDSAGHATVCMNIGLIQYEQGQFIKAQATLESALSVYRDIAAPDPWILGHLVNNLGMVYAIQGDFALAQECFVETLRLRRVVASEQAIASALHNLGELALDQGDAARATGLLQESLEIMRQLGDTLNSSQVQEGLGRAACERGDMPQAQTYLATALEGASQAQSQYHIAIILISRGYCALITGDLAQAHQELAAAQQICERHAMRKQLSLVYLNQSRLAVMQQNHEDAWHWLALVAQPVLASAMRPHLLTVAEQTALLVAGGGNPAAATRLWQLIGQTRRMWAIPRPRSLDRWYQGMMKPLSAPSDGGDPAAAPSQLLELLTKLFAEIRHGAF